MSVLLQVRFRILVGPCVDSQSLKGLETVGGFEWITRDWGVKTKY